MECSKCKQEIPNGSECIRVAYGLNRDDAFVEDYEVEMNHDQCRECTFTREELQQRGDTITFVLRGDPFERLSSAVSRITDNTSVDMLYVDFGNRYFRIDLMNGRYQCMG